MKKTKYDTSKYIRVKYPTIKTQKRLNLSDSYLTPDITKYFNLKNKKAKTMLATVLSDMAYKKMYNVNDAFIAGIMIGLHCGRKDAVNKFQEIDMLIDKMQLAFYIKGDISGAMFNEIKRKIRG